VIGTAEKIKLLRKMVSDRHLGLGGSHPEEEVKGIKCRRWKAILRADLRSLVMGV
jgi:hypothetical protein